MATDATSTSGITPLVLFDDNPAIQDLLGFDAVVAPVIEALRHRDLDPVTVGVHAPWGGGKSTLLNLIAAEAPADWLIVRTTPWEYEDQLDVKGTLISEVLARIQARVEGDAGLTGKVTALFKRVSWSRVGMVLAKGALTMQWDPDKLVDAFSPTNADGPRSLAAFRSEFEDLVKALPDVTKVVVLVDDLDRCLPDAVMATLEAIKLFLSVKRMAFVIAADQEMVRDAIRASLAGTGRSEEFAERYLEKIVQLPVSMPRLSPTESEAYIGLLLAQARNGRDSIGSLVAHCAARRRAGLAPLLGELEGLAGQPSPDDLRLAAQLNHGLSPDKRGNPREIKRQLNAFGVRSQVAVARGLVVRPDVVLKMLLLEDRWPTAFKTLVGTPIGDRGKLLASWEAWAHGELEAAPEGSSPEVREWAAADPRLGGLDLEAYINLAGTLSAASLGSALSDAQRQTIRRLLSDSDALRDQAVEDIGNATDEDRHKIGAALLEEARRTAPESMPNLVTGLVAVAKGSPSEAADLAKGIRDRMWHHLVPATGVNLATSEVPEFLELATAIVEAPNVAERVRVATKNAMAKD